ncbi:hypothetical protein [Streptomyces sp. NPDC020362]|uniref:hypothetical protein n=1 Tax=unclassified Streptomyces TaxID=2593676 RepID=UPI00340ED85A
MGSIRRGVTPVGTALQTRYTVQQHPPAGSRHYRYEKGEPLDDRACTPGAISPPVTQGGPGVDDLLNGRLHQEHPPSESVTRKEKQLNGASYAYKGSLGDAEYDHLFSHQLGSDPNDARNLWVEPADPGHKPGSGVNNLKVPVETKLHTVACSGKVTLTAAR